MQLDLPLVAFDVEHSAPRTGDHPPRRVRLPPPTLKPEPGAVQIARALEFVRHPKARRYIIRVRNDGTVRVTIPRGGSKREGEEFAQRQAQWVERQRARIEHENAQHRQAMPPDVERDLRERARVELPARLLHLAAVHGLRVTRISVRNQRWRWGSCSRSGHICLNWRLVQMPASVRDYVLIHELMHLKRMDHSPRFWELVAAACPDYDASRAWLRGYAR